jgi:hypothetical protein
VPRTLPGRLCARSRRDQTRGSGREPVAASEPACPDNRSSGARRHPVPETVILRPLPGVGLVGPLHSLSSFESCFERLGYLSPESGGKLGASAAPVRARRCAHARPVRSERTTHGSIRDRICDALSRQTPRSGRPLAATRTPVYRSGAGLPRQAATSQIRIRRPSRPGAPGPLRVCRTGFPVGNPHLWTALWTNSGYEGPRSR